MQCFILHASSTSPVPWVFGSCFKPGPLPMPDQVEIIFVFVILVVRLWMVILA